MTVRSLISVFVASMAIAMSGEATAQNRPNIAIAVFDDNGSLVFAVTQRPSSTSWIYRHLPWNPGSGDELSGLEYGMENITAGGPLGQGAIDITTIDFYVDIENAGVDLAGGQFDVLADVIYNALVSYYSGYSSGTMTWSRRAIASKAALPADFPGSRARVGPVRVLELAERRGKAGRRMDSRRRILGVGRRRARPSVRDRVARSRDWPVRHALDQPRTTRSSRVS